MQQRELSAHRQEIISAVRTLLDRGVMQLSKHGNMSLRIPGTDQFLLTSVGGLEDLTEDNICLLDLEGNLIEGYINPVAREIVGMHSVVYQHREEVGSVLHTHSPVATAFAIANREIPVAYEAQVRFLGTIPVPVAGYGPRGSDESVKNIAAILRENRATGGLLLANHGTLTWGDNPATAVHGSVILEESAIATMTAEALGGAKDIPAHMLHATHGRVAEFEQRGTEKA